MRLRGVRICLIQFFSPVESVEAVGTHQVRFTLSRPFGPLFAMLSQATEIVNQIEPKLVVPISYKLPGLTLLAQNLEGIEKFAKEMGATDLTPQPKLQISVSPSVDETKLLILEPRGATATASVERQ